MANDDDPLYRRIPIIGDDIYQVGQVYSILDQSCMPEPVLIVKGFFAYAPTLVWALAKPEPLDLAFNRGRRGHKRIRKRRLKIMDLDQLPVPDKPGVNKVLFNIAKAGEKIGWYFLVIDATTDFAVNWSSMAYQFSGCETPDPMYAISYGDSLYYIETQVERTAQLAFTEVASGGGGIATYGGISLPNVGPWSISYEGVFDMLPYLGTTGEIKKVSILIRRNGIPMGEYDCDRGTDVNGKPTFTMAEISINPDTATWHAYAYITWTAGRVKATSHAMRGQGAAPSGITFDP